MRGTIPYKTHVNERNGEILRSLEREVEARETELNSWRERYQAVKRNYDEQLCTLLSAPSLII